MCLLTAVVAWIDEVAGATVNDQVEQLIRRQNALLEQIIPPYQTVTEIAVNVPMTKKGRQKLLAWKLD